jgi:radical SAM superfamily enzyme YgiQ (UPF0313 family)
VVRVALVNTNRIQPPIAPIGLDYMAEALSAARHRVELLDLCWEDDARAAIARFLDGASFGLVGLTLRNTDDCAFTSRQSFLPEFAGLVETIRLHTDAPIVLGGVGFSVMPEQVLALSNADAGVWGDGEFVLPELATRLDEKQEWHDLPSLIWRCGPAWQRNAPSARPLAGLPPMSRSWVDNRRYFRHGGQAGFETKRGCPGQCVYCADVVAKGNRSRPRPPAAVVDELERLLEQGIDHLHTCDGEFNLPVWHALEVCQEITRRGLGDKLRWYAYCSPGSFPRGLARAMRDAGCVGINFGVDHGEEEMLRRLGRGFTPADILNAARWSREAGMAVMLDLLLGSPGESRESLGRAVDLMKQAEPDRVGVSLGVRVYPGTELARQVASPEHAAGLVGGEDASQPLYFLEPAVAPFAFALLDTLVGDDRRFLFFDPARPERNYNYNANQRLVEAIRQGYRGAYWDILRRCE